MHMLTVIYNNHLPCRSVNCCHTNSFCWLLSQQILLSLHCILLFNIKHYCLAFILCSRESSYHSKRHCELPVLSFSTGPYWLSNNSPSLLPHIITTPVDLVGYMTLHLPVVTSLEFCNSPGLTELQAFVTITEEIQFLLCMMIISHVPLHIIAKTLIPELFLACSDNVCVCGALSGTRGVMAPTLLKNLILTPTLFDVPCYWVTCTYHKVCCNNSTATWNHRIYHNYAEM